MSSVESDMRFPINKAYSKQLIKQHVVSWGQLLVHNQATPRRLFIVWLACHQRLATANRLCRWELIANDQCSLFRLDNESHEHLFSQCSYGTSVRGKFMACFQSDNKEICQETEVSMLPKINRKLSEKAKLYSAMWCELIYMIWIQRCSKVFQGSCLSPDQVAKLILFNISCRVVKYS